MSGFYDAGKRAHNIIVEATYSTLKNEITRLTAENERYRKALEHLSTRGEVDVYSAKIAREALEVEERTVWDE